MIKKEIQSLIVYYEKAINELENDNYPYSSYLQGKINAMLKFVSDLKDILSKIKE